MMTQASALANFRSPRHAALHALAATGVGLLGLPAAMAALEPSEARAWLWLGAAMLSSLWLFSTAPALIETLARAISRAPLRLQTLAEHADHVPFDIARLTVAAGYLVMVQAVIRRPLVQVLGANAEPFIVEASVACVSLVLLLLLLTSIHRAARPLIEGVAWLTLDSLIATSEASTAGTRQTRADERGSAPSAAPTLLAPRRLP